MISLRTLSLGLLLSSAALAPAAPHTYQVTGPITQLSETSITVQKAPGDNWEISRDSNAKVTGDLKVGSKVTVEYSMSATKITAKEDKSAAAPTAAGATSAATPKAGGKAKAK
jgi:hypothetical protein